MSDRSPWQPSEELLLDVRHTLAHAPRDTADDRFEAWAWRALLDEDGPGLLTRHAAPCHLTASAIVLSTQGSHTCLVLHRKLHRWVQPGGHFEAGDRSVHLAAAREAQEETGLTGDLLPEVVGLSRHPAPCRPGVVDWHLDLQHALITPMTPPTTSAESLDVAWFPVDALPEELAGGVAENVIRAVRALRGRLAAATP